MLWSSARPILAGQTDRARRVGEELAPHREQYEALNARYRIRSHAMWVSHPRVGPDLYVAMYDIEPDGLAEMVGRVWQPERSAYDRWWLGWVRDVLGIDLLNDSGNAAPPEAIHAWTVDGAP